MMEKKLSTILSYKKLFNNSFIVKTMFNDKKERLLFKIPENNIVFVEYEVIDCFYLCNACNELSYNYYPLKTGIDKNSLELTVRCNKSILRLCFCYECPHWHFHVQNINGCESRICLSSGTMARCIDY